MVSLCSPSLVYLFFSILQILFDVKNKLYNTAFMKLIVVIVITILLNILCQRGQTLIAWLIVFIPFIFMSVIVGILLFIFGLDPKTGKINILSTPSTQSPNNLPEDVYLDASGNVVVFDPYYNPSANPVYYKYPNIIVPKPPPPPPAPYNPETSTDNNTETENKTTTITTPNNTITVTKTK